MDASSMDTMAAAPSAESRQVAGELARWWWAWIVSGTLWILASVFILQFRQGSIALVGIILGVMFLVAGVEEFVVSAVSNDGWKWLRIVFGMILVAGGLYALFNPVGTFLSIASMLGFLFVLVGVFWVIDAFTTQAANPLWWLGLIAGFLMIGLGFWAGGQFLATQAYALLVFAGIWALMHGITDIIKAFAIRRLGKGTMAAA
ncbi:MAG TPA: DUF308 domain-containing protein [Ktedonobacterales bacterium]|nr:DUF308 domain-containing protein [Ktedonobacterales bacterium]